MITVTSLHHNLDISQFFLSFEDLNQRIPTKNGGTFLSFKKNNSRFIEIENGEWRMENGEWRMENGEWRMENGEWRMENGNNERMMTFFEFFLSFLKISFYFVYCSSFFSIK
jgi:hypothetical protein